MCKAGLGPLCLGRRLWLAKRFRILKKININKYIPSTLLREQMAKKTLSRYKDTNKPTKKALRDSVERREGQCRLLGAQASRQK